MSAFVGALAGCSGTSWVLEAPAGSEVLVDGRREERSILPARYFGTVVVDALPVATGDALGTFTRGPGRRSTMVGEPVSPWLFPLDFLLELAARLFGTTREVRIEASLEDEPERVVGFPPSGMDQVRGRALAARVLR
ncbi:MAG: hypothetical protein Fur0037_23630 [Planctomycetota bacterium]